MIHISHYVVAFFLSAWMTVAVAGAFTSLAPEAMVPEVAYSAPADPCANVVVDGAEGVAAHLLGKIDPLFDLTASGVVASALIIGVLLWLRSAFPARLAPEPSTETSRLWNLGLALITGQVLGLLTIAPAIPIPGRTLDGGTLILARMFGGFVVSTVAVFGRDFFTRSCGMFAEARAATKPPDSPPVS